jgi:hypothetical protein
MLCGQVILPTNDPLDNKYFNIYCKLNSYNKILIIVQAVQAVQAVQSEAMENIGALLSGTRSFSEKFIDQYFCKGLLQGVSNIVKVVCLVRFTLPCHILFVL